MADKTKDVIKETATDEAVPEMNPTGDTLNLTDIAAVIQIIDVVTKSGAFEGNEMADVGSIRNRLEKFIKAAAPAPTEAAPKTEEK